MLFAVDSVPAVLAVSHEQFIVFTSNAFAILGLRALYFLLADLHARFSYLQQGLAIILAFVGVKMIISRVVPHPDVGSRSLVIVLVLAASIGFSLQATQRWRDIDRDVDDDGPSRCRRAADVHVRGPAAATSGTRRPRVASRLHGDRRRGPRADPLDGLDRRRRASSTSRCAGSAATGSGCARSTPSARRRSTSARRRAATSASAATRPATCSRSSRRSSTSTSSARSSSWPRKAGIQLHYTTGGESKERAAPQAAGRGDGARRSTGTTTACSTRPTRAHGTRLPAQPRPRRRRRPHVQARLGARRLGRAEPATLGRRRRPAPRHRPGVHEQGRAVCRTRSAPGCCSRSSPRTASRSAFGGRILPGSTDPAKYKNSPETPIYTKSKTLYGLNWAKGDIVAADQVIVCEGYTDVIGFHRAGLRACRRDVRHGVHRGARAPAEALRQQGRAGVRRRRGRPGRGRAVLRVGAEVPGRGQRRARSRRARTRAS